MATLVRHARYAGRKVVIGFALTIIGIVVGFGCALLPIGVPVGIVALAAVLLLWTMPDIQFVPKSWTSAMFVPFTFTLLAVPSFFGLILPGLPWISVRRAVLLLWIAPLCIVLAGSAETRSYVFSTIKRSGILYFCILAFVTVMIISTVVGVAPLTSLSYNINFCLICFMPMIAIVLLVRDASLITRFFTVAIIAAGVDLIVGAIEFRLQRPFLIYVLPSWMRDQILSSNPTAVLTLVNGLGTRGGMYRASSIYTTPLSWGEVSAMILPMCLHFVAHGKSLFQRAFGFAGIVLCFLSVFLSGSRGAYVGMLAASITYSLAWSIRSLRKQPYSLAGPIWITFYAMVSASALVAVVFVSRIRKVVIGGTEVQGSTDARAAQWAMAQPKILARPFFGYGAGTSGDVVHYTSPGGLLTLDGFHMTLLVDYGIPGFILFFAMFLVSAYTFFTIYIKTDSPEGLVGAAFGAGLLAFMLYRFTLSQVDSLPLAFMIVGFAIAYRQITAPKQEVKFASQNANLAGTASAIAQATRSRR